MDPAVDYCKDHFPAHQIGISVVFTHVKYLTYPYQPVEKIKNEQPPSGRTSNRDVILKLK